MDALPHPARAQRRTVGVAIAVVPLLAGCIALPNLKDALEQAPAQTTKVYAADGSLITELHAEENREVIPLSDVPQHVRDAVVAVEDARFYSHPGIDLQGILRALSVNAQEGRVVEGGSTITQQYIKNTVITKERTLERKVREAILAFQLEQRFTKDEILERYLNTVYFGRGAYGIEAAAKVFFGRHARNLRLHEGALLAGLIRAPGRFDPGDVDAARDRRTYVLRRMLDERMITEEEYLRTRERPLGLRPSRDTETYPYGYFVEYVKQQIFDGAGGLDVLGASTEERVNAVFKGGLRIYTTLDPRLQRVAEANARRTLPYKSDPYTAFVGVKPETGAIASMVGGRGFFKKDRFKKLNLAVRRRSPGSSFKPFTLIAALERGIPLSRSYRGGSRLSLRLPNGTIWSIGNYQGMSFGSTVTLLRATALSVNVVYAQVVLEVGADAVVKVARKMGITSPLEAVPAISIGSEEVTPLEMAQAYATLANQGNRVRLTSIERITDASGRELYRYEPKPKRVLTEPVAAAATDALAEVMRTGTGRNLTFGRPAAGKTGTSENYADAWYAGFTPDYVGIAWVGFPEGQIGMVPPRTRIRVYGSSWPGQMWESWMAAAHRGLPTREFPIADDLYVSVRVDSSRDCLPNEFTPPYLIRSVQYIKGSEPTEVCTEPKSGRIPSTPDVIGDEAAVARRTLQEAGFRVETISTYCPAFKRGRVCDQEPEPGTASTVGSTARISVSGPGEVSEVPMVLGRTLERARQKLADSGYEVVVRTQANTETAAGCRDTFVTESGRVWLQSPCAGASLRRGGTVTITVNP
jgi:penicillin-binding protein 1A